MWRVEGRFKKRSLYTVHKHSYSIQLCLSTSVWCRHCGAWISGSRRLSVWSSYWCEQCPLSPLSGSIATTAAQWWLRGQGMGQAGWWWWGGASTPRTVYSCRQCCIVYVFSALSRKTQHYFILFAEAFLRQSTNLAPIKAGWTISSTFTLFLGSEGVGLWLRIVWKGGRKFIFRLWCTHIGCGMLVPLSAYFLTGKNKGLRCLNMLDACFADFLIADKSCLIYWIYL